MLRLVFPASVTVLSSVLTPKSEGLRGTLFSSQESESKGLPAEDRKPSTDFYQTLHLTAHQNDSTKVQKIILQNQLENSRLGIHKWLSANDISPHTQFLKKRGEATTQNMLQGGCSGMKAYPPAS